MTAAPPFDSPHFNAVIREFKRGVSPLKTNLPLPLFKGKGIQEMGLPNYQKLRGGALRLPLFNLATAKACLYLG